MKKTKLICTILIGAATLTACQQMPLLDKSVKKATEAADTQSVMVQKETTATKDSSSEIASADSMKTNLFSISYKEDKKKYQDVKGKHVLLNDSNKYPIVSSKTNQKAADKINADWNQINQKHIANGKQMTQESSTAYQDTSETMPDTEQNEQSYQLSDSAVTMRNDGKVISFYGVSSTYTGGAHGNNIAYGYNYNATTGDRLQIKDLSNTPDAFKQQILNYVQSLCKTDAYKDMLEEDYSNSLQEAVFGTDNWYFSNAGFVIAISPDFIAPHAAGIITFTIPYEILEIFGMKKDYQYTGRYEAQAVANQPLEHDLNGDGIIDTVTYTLSNTDGSAKLQINGKNLSAEVKKICNTKNYMPNYYYLYDLNPADKSVEIGLVSYENSNIDERTYFFQYETDKTLKYLGYQKGDALNADFSYKTGDKLLQ